MIAVKATQDSEASMLFDDSGLQPSSSGWQVHYASDKRTVIIDGPFTETKELITGYTLIQVRSREEAAEWLRRFPNPTIDGDEAEIEVRRLFELEDFVEPQAIDRFQKLETRNESPS
ncbi:YciI family protein [Pistricoccus aurantiacus]|nr:YciI family protein [Pistricoccus aurantiacus]